ncbi:Hypothetical predicted protein, partial [Pelobates cultripes]
MAESNLPNGEEDEIQRVVQRRLALYGRIQLRSWSPNSSMLRWRRRGRKGPIIY